jgi:hypothetical protein
VVYTTNAIESLNFSLRKIIKGRSAFPNDDSVYRLIYLGRVSHWLVSKIIWIALDGASQVADSNQL